MQAAPVKVEKPISSTLKPTQGANIIKKMETAKPPIVQKWEAIAKAIKKDEKSPSLIEKKSAVMTQSW